MSSTRTLAAAAALFLGEPAFAADTLQIRVATERWDQQGHLCFYDQDLSNGLDLLNRNMVVIWLEDEATGRYVRTLYRWGQNYIYNLEDWAIASDMVVDGVSSATQPCYSGETCGSGANQMTAPPFLDTGAITISDLPDGSYRVRIETSSCEVADEYASGTMSWETPDTTLSFTKGRSSQANVTFPDAFPFSGIRLDYVVGAGNAPPGIHAGADQWITPSGSVAQATVSVTTTDDTGTPSILWSFEAVEPAGGTATFADPSSATTDVSFTVSGIYTLRATASDGQGATSFDRVKVYVNARLVAAEADAEVYSGNPNRTMGVLVRNPPAAYNAGAWVYSWGANNAPPCNAGNADRARGYFRFDVGAASSTIDLARLQLPIAEQRRDTAKWHDLYILTDAMDDWVPAQADDEATITWNNQPVAGGNASGLQLAGTYRHRLDYNTWVEIDLDVPAITSLDSNGLWSLFYSPRDLCNGMGVAARENRMEPRVLIVDHWQSAANASPVAVAGPMQTRVDADGNGMEVVTLDGTGSTDDVAVITYEWREGATLLGTGATLPVTLALGLHAIDLTVIDGAGAFDTASVQVLVDDRFRPNDTSAEGEPIVGDAGGRLYANLFTLDQDWFVLDLAGGGDLTVAMSAPGGDLDVILYQSDATTEIDRAETASLMETVSASGLAAGQYYVEVRSAQGAATASAFDLTVTVAGPALSVALSPTSASESAGRIAAGTVSINTPSPADTIVMLSSQNVARLSLPVASVTIPSGQTSAPFDLQVADNTIADGNATVTVRAAAAGFNPGSADFLVIDDDGVSLLVSWSQASASLSETRSPLVILDLQLSAAAPSDVVVPFTVEGTASGGADFDSGPLSSGTLTITAGNDETSLLFSIIDDTVDEPDETVILRIGSPAGAVAGTPSTFTLTITDDDAPEVPFMGNDPPNDAGGGCGCRAASRSPFEPGIGLALLALLGLSRRRGGR
jgi:hypothetical protein